MAQAACTFGGRSNYNNGWAWKYFNTATGYGHSGFGRDYYGHHRCIVLKITTPTFDSTWINRQLQINIPMCRSSSAGTGTDTFYYRVTTTAPTFSEGGKTQITFPTDSMCSGSLAIGNESAGNGYTMRQITTVAANFASNTTYYIWLWSDTPYVANSNSYVGYYSHHASYGGLISVNLTYTLMQKSTMSVGNGTLGKSQTLTVRKQVSSYTHTITYTCGSASGTICAKSSSTSVSFTPPLTLAAQNTTGTTVSVTFTITTYNGNTSLGSNSYTVKMTIPSGSSSSGGLSPSCSVSISDANGYATTFNAYIKNKSKLKFTVSVTCQQSATLKSCVVKVNGQTFNTTSGTTNYLASVGTNTIQVTITDSRGYTASTSATFTVIEYTSPTISTFNLYRSNSSGNASDSDTYAYLSFTISNYSALNNKNTKTITVQYWPSANPSTITQVDIGSFSVSGNTYSSVISGMSVDYGYTFKVTVKDYFSSPSRSGEIQSEFVLMEWYKNGTGISFGKVADTPNLFDCAMPSKFSRTVTIGSITNVENAITANQSSIASLESNKVSKSGDTMTGKLNCNGGFNVPLNTKLTWGGLNAGIWMSANQQMYFRSSDEANYGMHLGVIENVWAFNPAANGYLNLGSPSYRWQYTYSNAYFVRNWLLSDVNDNSSQMSLCHGAYTNKYQTAIFGKHIYFAHTTDSNGDGNILRIMKENSGNLRTIFRCDVNGGAYLGTTSYRWNTGYFTNTITQSDRKTKENFKDVEKAVEFIMSLNPQMYTLKNSDSENPRWHVGLIAQDVAATAKELGLGDLSLYQAAVIDDEGNELPYVEGTDDEKLSWGLNYQEIIPYLVKAFQSLYTEIKEKQYEQ